MTPPNRPNAPTPRAALPEPRPRLRASPGAHPLPPIAIAGAGIAGLTAASAIARTGRKVIVLERAGAPYELGAGIQMAPNAMRVLARLGLGNRLAEIAVAPQTLEVRSAADGHLIAQMPLGETAARRFASPYLVLPRAVLHRHLSEAAVRTGAEIRYGAALAGVTASGGGVDIETTGGTHIEARGLIGADGLWSRTRAAIAPDREPDYSGKVAWRTTIPREQVPREQVPTISARTDDPPRVTLWLAPGLHAVHYPIDSAGTLNIVVVTEGSWRGSGWEEAGGAPELPDGGSGLCEPLLAIITAAREWRRWPLFRLTPPPPAANGPIALIGDAAHPMLPFLAQAAAMSIEDAHVIAGMLAASPRDIIGAFSRYARARAARIGRVTAASRRNGRVFHLGGPFAGARDLIMGAVAGPALLRRYDWLYGGGPVPR